MKKFEFSKSYPTPEYGGQYQEDEYYEQIDYSIVAKPDMLPRIWFDYHENLSCYGRDKTVKTIQRVYYLAKARAVVAYARTISSCCQRTYKKNQAPSAPLRP